jgi:hypothetical protein
VSSRRRKRKRRRRRSCQWRIAVACGRMRRMLAMTASTMRMGLRRRR